MKSKMNKVFSGWPCDYCGEITPDWESTCEKCFEEHKKEILAKLYELKVKRKRKSRNEQA